MCVCVRVKYNYLLVSPLCRILIFMIVIMSVLYHTESPYPYWV